VLVLGQRIDTVIGDRSEVPYIDLPALGGPFSLRGYPRARFRDRIAAEATAEYRYGLSPNLTARTFVDVGRTFPAVDELTLDQLRTGFGGGLLVHTGDSIRARFDVAGSVDGDLFVLFSWGEAP
jgi:outer membrane translocation and assembly module TamA